MSPYALILSLLLLVDASWGLTDTNSISPGQFPSYASVVASVPLAGSVPACGGVIINANWILTSGQCDCVGFYPEIGEIKVKVGVQTYQDSSSSVQTLDVAKVFINKNLVNGLFLVIKENDIALLKLASSITFNDRVQPATLPLTGSTPTGRATVVGLGASGGSIVPTYPSNVQALQVQLINRVQCKQAIGNASIINNRELSNQLCSLPVNKVGSACYGDSGDPLYQTLGKNAVVIGILSWGSYPCRQSNAPIIYTNVAAFLDFISQTIRDN